MRKRELFVAVILFVAALFIYAFPKQENKNMDLVSTLAIPDSCGEWLSKDMSAAIDKRDLKYGKINRILARAYTNAQKKQLLFMVLNSSNFHNPKTCFGASGYNVKELGKIVFDAPRNLKADALYFYKKDDARLVIYWMCIDKKIVGWLGQKTRELGFSLLNKQRKGVMVRLDIPTREAHLGDSISLAKNFIASIAPSIAQIDAEYIFGE